MNRDASSTDHDIPALILKECKNNISYPVFLIWKESFESEVIPEDMKIQSITPIFKKGDKSDPGYYRPISLTSHLIKIFERVIRKKVVCHLESYSILSNKVTSSTGFIKVAAASLITSSTLTTSSRVFWMAMTTMSFTLTLPRRLTKWTTKYLSTSCVSVEYKESY